MTVQGIDLVTFVVDDQEDAIAFYVDTLGFELVEDEQYGPTQRWVEIAPPGSTAALTLKTPEMYDEPERTHLAALIGTGPMVTYRVENCDALYAQLKESGVHFDGPPREASWGVSVTARDPSGNPVVLTESAAVR